jgi:hypothetical protein
MPVEEEQLDEQAERPTNDDMPAEESDAPVKAPSASNGYFAPPGDHRLEFQVHLGHDFTALPQYR